MADAVDARDDRCVMGWIQDPGSSTHYAVSAAGYCRSQCGGGHRGCQRVGGRVAWTRAEGVPFSTEQRRGCVSGEPEPELGR